MTASVEYIPITPIEYPDEDGKPMAEGDIQCSYLTYAINALQIHLGAALIKRRYSDKE